MLTDKQMQEIQKCEGLCEICSIMQLRGDTSCFDYIVEQLIIARETSYPVEGETAITKTTAPQMSQNVAEKRGGARQGKSRKVLLSGGRGNSYREGERLGCQ